MKFCIWLILYTAIYFTSFSQHTSLAETSKIIGKIVDSITSLPVEYATISVYVKGNPRPVNGLITDSKGNFSFSNLEMGEYIIKVEFIGYTTHLVNITLTKTKPEALLGNIYLSDNSRSLQGVTVVSSHNIIENHIDKLVFNVEKDITSQGGMATDVLKKVPQISVDVDGNIELLGNANVHVYINGKPSTMFDNNITDALQSIPASQIKSIEVITSPGAKYDAEGTAGIINIILKEYDVVGVNGSAALSAGSRLENGSANLNIRKGALNLSASLNANALLRGTTLNSLERHSYDSAGNSVLMQNGNGTLHRNGYRGQIGMDWDLTKKDNFTASLSYNHYGNYIDGITDQSEGVYVNSQYGALNTTNTSRSFTNQYLYGALDWHLDYKKKFAEEGQELNISLQQSNGRNDANYTQNQAYLPGDSLFSRAMANNIMHDRETYLQIDYSQPVRTNINLETGVKCSFSDIKSYSDNNPLNPEANRYMLDSSQVDHFNYLRQVYAAYISFSCDLPKGYKLKIGIRDEQTEANANSAYNVHVVPSYNFFIPTFTIAHTYNNQTLKFSYTRRIERPGYKQLNPFIDATDPTNLAAGNPTLRPERGQSTELSYSRFFDKGGSILATLFYRYNADDHQNYVAYYSSLAVGDSTYKNVAVNMEVNVGSQQLTGLNIYGAVTVVPNLEIRVNAMVLDKYITGDLGNGTIHVNSINLRSNINASYQLGKTIAVEFFGNFNSARTEIQGTFPSNISYSFAARKYFFNKKGSIAFTTTDPFNEYIDQRTNVAGVNFSYVSDRKIPYRSFGLSFSYKFGSKDYKPKKDDKEFDNPEEAN